VRRIVQAAAYLGLTLLAIEPGRVLVGAAGVLLTRVVDVKQFPGHARRFVVLDAGMTELMRPALYDAFTASSPVRPRPGAPSRRHRRAHLREHRHLRARPPAAARRSRRPGGDSRRRRLRRGDGLELPAAAAAAGGDGGRRAWRVIRRRQTLDDMLALEQ
jgi:hypothetical protein